MMEDYWQLMPAYQNVTLEELEVRRVLFGSFPTYKDSPLKTQWSRICQIGDAGGAQSPLSFGGFACLTRHVRRLTSAFNDALEADLLRKNDLRRINSYLPSLSATWMFQKSMSVGIGERVNKNLIVDLLSNNFKSMNKLGDTTLKPFLQDVVQFVPLSKILLGVTFSAPLSIPPLLLHVGPIPLLTWMYHFTQVRQCSISS
jgi:lycopene cyclase CruP